MAFREFSQRPNGAPQFIQDHTTTLDAGNTTAEVIAGPSIKVLGRSLGKNGNLIFRVALSCTNSANAKTARVRVATSDAGALTGTLLASRAVTTQTGIVLEFSFNVRNNYAAQLLVDVVQGTVSTSALDTTQDLFFQITTQKATGTETLKLESYVVELNAEPNVSSFQ
jgi:hypothetical protein